MEQELAASSTFRQVIALQGKLKDAELVRFSGQGMPPLLSAALLPSSFYARNLLLSVAAECFRPAAGSLYAGGALSQLLLPCRALLIFRLPPPYSAAVGDKARALLP